MVYEVLNFRDPNSVMKEELRFGNYVEKFEALLKLEAETQKKALHSHNINATQMFQVSGPQEKYRIHLIEKYNDFVSKGSLIRISILGTEQSFNTEVLDVDNNYLYIKCDSKLTTPVNISVNFIFSGSLFDAGTRALKHVRNQYGEKILFPKKVLMTKQRASSTPKWFNKSLNEIQRCAIINILQNISHPLPYVIFGPAGTGKTVTVIELIRQLASVPNNYVLVVSSANSAVDVITEALLPHYKNDLIRISSAIQSKKESKDYYTVKFDKNEKFLITLTTCNKAKDLLPYFTHVIIDEAGKATEPETMIPVTKLGKGQLILSGDPMQLAPYVESQECVKYGLGISYLERLLRMPPYQRDKHSKNYDDRTITLLRYNYRSVKHIVEISSDLYYNGGLISLFNPNDESVKDIQQRLPSKYKGGGIFLHHVNGLCEKENNGNSYMNRQEANELVKFVMNLYQNGICANQIGIIVPYLQQISLIKQKFWNAIREVYNVKKGSMDAESNMPEVGTVEAFQGREVPIAIISTVRSNSPLGFVDDSKRLNVMITRGKILTVIFGNMTTLRQSQDFRTVINFCKRNNACFGHDNSIEERFDDGSGRSRHIDRPYYDNISAADTKKYNHVENRSSVPKRNARCTHKPEKCCIIL